MQFRCSSAKVVFASIIAGASLYAVATHADVVSVAALQDAMIFADSSGNDTAKASGNGPGLFAGADGSGNKKRSVIEFDLSSIPKNATINSVTMTLYFGQIAGSGGPSGGGSLPSRTIRLFDVQQSWTEGSSGTATSPVISGGGQGYNRSTNDVTWDYASYQPTDTTAGHWGTSTNIKHGGNVSATESADSTFTSFTTVNVPFTWTDARMAADVQSWVTGSAANSGWLLQSDLENTATSFIGFWSKEGAAAAAASSPSNSGLAPFLSIDFTVVPEPNSALLLISGLTALATRRRRQ